MFEYANYHPHLHEFIFEAGTVHGSKFVHYSIPSSDFPYTDEALRGEQIPWRRQNRS